MHPLVFKEFERICTSRPAKGHVLEIGAVPSDESLLCLEALREAKSKTGINLEGPYSCRDFEILPINANQMEPFEDNRFDTVLCNSTLEHDPFFWKTLREIRRVLRPGGLLVIGVPGLTDRPEHQPQLPYGRIPLLSSIFRSRSEAMAASTTTLRIHNFPGDFYRFTPQAVKEVFFARMMGVEVVTIMAPPRIIGSGYNR